VRKSAPFLGVADGRLEKKTQPALGALGKILPLFFWGGRAKMALKMSFFKTSPFNAFFIAFFTLYAFRTAFFPKKSRF
jgi:hypothetical protein